MDKHKKPEDVLADNVDRLMGDVTYAKFPAKVGQGTITRVLKGQNVRLSTLDAIARAYRLQAWELLTPDFDPANPPAARIEAERTELEELRQWRDDIFQREEETRRAAVVDAGRTSGNAGSGEDKGKKQESRANGKGRT